MVSYAYFYHMPILKAQNDSYILGVKGLSRSFCLWTVSGTSAEPIHLMGMNKNWAVSGKNSRAFFSNPGPPFKLYSWETDNSAICRTENKREKKQAPIAYKSFLFLYMSN